MLYIYTSIAVLFGGAYCFPANNTTEKPLCTVVIKRFDEPVTTLEVEWHSSIDLICDASCVGPGPQPALTWFYRHKKNQSNLINIERLFRSPKFDTFTLTSHRTKELRIRDFGPDEETMFICKGSIRGKKYKQMVKLNGTDCLMKYKFRCQSDKKCIHRGQLCDYYNDCPDGEDEFGCGKNIYNTTTEATTRIPEKDVVITQTSEESDYIDLTTTVSIPEITETDVETMQTSADRKPCDFQCRDGTCIASTKKCDGIPDCPDGDDENCEFGPSCSEGKKACKDSSICIDDSQRCNGVPDCPDRDDEADCEFGPSCSEGKKACKDSSICIDDSQLCNGVPDCPDRGDEVDCDTGSLTTKALEEDGKNYDVGEDKVIITTLLDGTGIHVDREMDPVSTTDGVSATTAEFTKTTSFGYDDYI